LLFASKKLLFFRNEIPSVQKKICLIGITSSQIAPHKSLWLYGSGKTTQSNDKENHRYLWHKLHCANSKLAVLDETLKSSVQFRIQ